MTGATVKLGATSLMYACQQGKESQVYEIIKSKPGTILERERSLKTALHYCAEAGEGGAESAAALLRAAPELVAAQDQDGYTALHLAVIAGNLHLAQLLIAHGADLNTPDNEGHTAAHWATVCGELECLELILKKKGNPDRGDMHGGCPLHYAAQMCGPGSGMPADRRLGMAALRLLIDHGADPNIPDHHGRQPILWAASAGSSEAILVLTNAGANVEAADKDGLTALHCAASRGHTDCVEALISLCNAEADVIDNNGCSALFYAVTLGHADSTQALLNHGANTNRQDRKGRTAMHCGAAKGQVETLKVVWSRGGNLWTRTARGDYPLHEAVTSGRTDLVSWLLALRPDAVNSPNNDGRCPLHLAAIHNNIEMCKVLLDAGSLVNPVMRTGKGLLATPLDAALHKGHRGTAKYLQLHGGVPAGRLNSESAALRGPNSRNSGVQSQKPQDSEMDNIQEHLDQTNSSPTIHQKKIQLPPQKQKILQVYVEDGVMIKRIKHPQALDDDRVRRRRRKRKSRHLADKASRIEKDKYKLDDYEDSTEEEGDTSQTSSYIDSRMRTDSDSGSPTKEPKISQNNKVTWDSRQETRNLNENIDEMRNITDMQESETEFQKHVQDVEVELHRPFEEKDDESISNVETAGEVKENEPSEGTGESNELQTSEDRADESAKLKESESTQSDVTVVEQTVGARKKKSIDEQKEPTSIEKEVTAVSQEVATSENNEVEGMVKEVVDKTPDSSIKVDQDLEVQTEKQELELVGDSVAQQKNENEVEDESKVTISSDLKLETDNENDTKNEGAINTENIQETLKVEEENQGVIDEEMSEEKQPDLYDSLEYEPNDTQIPGQDENEITDSKTQEVVVGEVDPIENDNNDSLPVDNESTGDKNQDFIDGENIVKNEETSEGVSVEDTIQKDKLNEIVSEISENEEKINEGQAINEISQKDESSIIDEGKESIIENELQKTLPESKPTNEIGEDQLKNKEIEEQSIAQQEEPILEQPQTEQNATDILVVDENEINTNSLIEEEGIGERDSSEKALFDKDAIEAFGDNSKGLIKVLDDEDQSSRRTKPKRKEWKRESSREKWEPRAIGTHQEDSESARKSPTPDTDQPSSKREKKNGIKGVRPKSKSRIPRMCAKSQNELDDDVSLSTVSVTQAVQYSVRKYHLERRIFHQLLELKRLQIRAGRSSEGVLVKRLVDDYRRAGLMLGLQQYNGVYTFRAFERYLYDQLRLLQSSERRIIPRLKSSDDLERLTSALRKTRAGQEILTTIPSNPALCTYQTHRCHHATHAYTGIPCAAYIRKDHHTMPKPGSFLPKIGEKTGDLAKTLRYVDPTRPLTLELSHGSEKQVITLPTEKLDKSKRYFVTFTIKTGNQKKVEGSQKHTHPSSV